LSVPAFAATSLESLAAIAISAAFSLNCARSFLAYPARPSVRVAFEKGSTMPVANYTTCCAMLDRGACRPLCISSDQCHFSNYRKCRAAGTDSRRAKATPSSRFPRAVLASGKNRGLGRREVLRWAKNAGTVDRFCRSVVKDIPK
jgi:hypothetical protein